ncbi:hypothetical protein Efla_004339 [Eimeria flavescens]
MGGPPQRGPHVGPQLCQLTRAISFLFLCVLLLLFSPLGCIGSSLKFSGSYPFPWGRERPQNAIIRRQLHLAFLQHTPLLHPSCSSSSSSWREISSSRAPALQAASGSSGEGSKDNTSSSSDNSSSSSDKGQKPSVRVLELTDSARRKLLELREQQGLPPEEDLLLRLAVKSGGCSGLSYSLERIGKVTSCCCLRLSPSVCFSGCSIPPASPLPVHFFLLLPCPVCYCSSLSVVCLFSIF